MNELELKYGCNPNQKPARIFMRDGGDLPVAVLNGKPGYINFLDAFNAWQLVKELKEQSRQRIAVYAQRRPSARYQEGCAGIWNIPCGIALPCATQNELSGDAAKTLIANGCFAVAEGANMPCTPQAVDAFQAAGVLFAPAKAANAGGVATSALEMSQNSMRFSWTFDEVDEKLHGIMTNIYHNAAKAAEEYGMAGNLVAGANIAGFLKVADAMLWQGISY